MGIDIFIQIHEKLANSINVNLESELVRKKPEFEKEYSFLKYFIVKENN